MQRIFIQKWNHKQASLHLSLVIDMYVLSLVGVCVCIYRLFLLTRDPEAAQSLEVLGKVYQFSTKYCVLNIGYWENIFG